MISQVADHIDVLPQEDLQVPPVPHHPNYRVRWTPFQRIARLWQKPLNWFLGRAYRRVLSLTAPAVAFWISQFPIIFAVASTLVRFRIFDRLASGAASVDELASATGTDHKALLRLLRTASAIGLLKRQWDGKFALSPVGRQFLSDSRNPVSAWSELVDRCLVPALPRLGEAIIGGESLCKTVYNKTCWEVMAEAPGTTELHDKACGRWTELVVDAVARAYDFTGVKSVIDVGGGRGSFLSAMLRAAPHVRGRVYDRETTREAARAMFADRGVADRADHECGNFFESVPAGADLYTIKHVLHDWDDEHAEVILRTIRRAVPDHGKLLIVEGSVDHDLLPIPSIRAVWDMTQFASTWGKSRTLDEFSELAARAGFRLANIYVPPTLDALILECLPDEIPRWHQKNRLPQQPVIPVREVPEPQTAE